MEFAESRIAEACPKDNTGMARTSEDGAVRKSKATEQIDLALRISQKIFDLILVDNDLLDPSSELAESNERSCDLDAHDVTSAEQSTRLLRERSRQGYQQLDQLKQLRKAETSRLEKEIQCRDRVFDLRLYVERGMNKETPQTNDEVWIQKNNGA